MFALYAADIAASTADLAAIAGEREWGLIVLLVVLMAILSIVFLVVFAKREAKRERDSMNLEIQRTNSLNELTNNVSNFSQIVDQKIDAMMEENRTDHARLGSDINGVRARVDEIDRTVDEHELKIKDIDSRLGCDTFTEIGNRKKNTSKKKEVPPEVV